MARHVIFTADDFGRDSPTNEAIVHSHAGGALRAASLMMGQPGTDEAIRLARKNPSLEVGWHAHVCDASPVARGPAPLAGSPLLTGLAIAFYGRRIRAELRAQWDLFMASGLRCAFINSHHHLHAHPIVLRFIADAIHDAPRAWVRAFDIRSFSGHLPAHARMLRFFGRQTFVALPSSVLRSTTTWGLDRTFAMNAEEIAAVLPGLGPGLHEFIFHPRQKNDRDSQALADLVSNHGISPSLP